MCQGKDVKTRNGSKMYTLIQILALLIDAVTFVDSNGIPDHCLAQLEEKFFVGAFNINENILAFSRNGSIFMKVKVDSWLVNNGVVKFTTPRGNWISLANNALVNPFRFTKVVYRYTQICEEIPEWYHGSAEFVPDGGYELHLIDSAFIPDGKWDEKQEQWVASLKDEGNLIYKGEYLVRESLLDEIKPLRERYNSYGEFGFRARRETKKEALNLARDKWEKDFIRWYITQ